MYQTLEQICLLEMELGRKNANFLILFAVTWYEILTDIVSNFTLLTRYCQVSSNL